MVIYPPTSRSTSNAGSGLPNGIPARVFPKRDAPEQLWVTIIDENNREIEPKTLPEAQRLLFDLNTTIPVKGSVLREGKHNLYVKVDVELKRDNRKIANASKDSSRVSLTVKNRHRQRELVRVGGWVPGPAVSYWGTPGCTAVVSQE
jgi:hypothetical protein